MAVDYATLKKGGFMRQKQKNNFSLRLRTVGGHMSAEQLAKVAEVAEKYGEGYVHLTSRQGVEIPFIKLDQIEEVKNALAEGDVVPGVCGPRVRTVTACQGAAICQSGCIDTYALAKELDERYFGYELPHKFKFGITGCQNNCLKAEENDVGIKGGMQVVWVEDKCIQFGKVNIVYEQELIEEYSVMSSPVLIFFKNGEEVDRITGAVSKHKIEEAIEKNK